ncbi:MAG: hypothetical protein ACOCZK_04740 [Planctomycetota bacterium]
MLIAAALRLPWWEVSLAGGGSLACGLNEVAGTAPGLAALLLLGLSALQLLLGCGGLLARQHPAGAAGLRAAELLRPCMTTGLLLLAALLPVLLSWRGTLPLRIEAGSGIWALGALAACALLANRGLDEPAAVRAMAAARPRGPRHLVGALAWTLLLLVTGCGVLLWSTPLLLSTATISMLGSPASPLALAVPAGWMGRLGIAALAGLLAALVVLATVQTVALIRQPGRRGRNRGGGLLVRLILLPPLLGLLPMAVTGHLGVLTSARLPIVWPLLGLGLAALALRALRERFRPRYTEAAS